MAVSMASASSSSSKTCYHADRTIFIQPILDNLSNLQQQLSGIEAPPVDDHDKRRGNRIELLCRELSYIRSAFENLDSFGGGVGDRLSQVEDLVRDVLNCVQGVPEGRPVSAEPIQLKIRSLASRIASLKAALPAVPRLTSTAPGTYKRMQADNRVHVHNEVLEQNCRGDGYSAMYEELVAGLNNRARELLLYFAAFPLDVTIHKRALKSWWIAEALSQLPADEAENKANRVLEELVLRGLIKAVRKQRRLLGFRMPHPWVHLALVRNAELKNFLAFDSKGNPTVDPQKPLSRGCLAKTTDGGSSVDLLNSDYPNAALEVIETVFNISEQYPYFRAELFSKAKGIRVLSLGKWQSSNDCHIEVESTEFLKAPKSFKDLRFFSLRGVSRVFQLPNVLCKLSSLTMLDLSACHNLDELPEGIGSLKSLIYLDISECYLLERIPKGLAYLTELRVLKGFLIINTAYGLSSCNFKDLAGLKKLKKLGINAHRRDFPTKDDLGTFEKFPLLEKLTISWGGKSILMEPIGQAVQAKSTPDPESEVQSQEAKTSSNQKPELISGEAKIQAHTDASGSLEDGAAEPIKFSDGKNLLDIKDNQDVRYSAAEPESRGMRNQDHAVNDAEKEMLQRRTERVRTTGEIVEEIEPAIDGEIAHATNAVDTIERKDSTAKPQPVLERVNTAGGARLGQPSETKKKPMKKTHSLLKWTKQQNEAAPKAECTFPGLEKLNLQCYPEKKAPDWLTPRNMKNLKKLYITGGKLQTLNKIQGDRTWKVEILRLKYLEELETSWEDLQALFPELIYFEKDQNMKLSTFKRDWKREWVGKTWAYASQDDRIL